MGFPQRAEKKPKHIRKRTQQQLLGGINNKRKVWSFATCHSWNSTFRQRTCSYWLPAMMWKWVWKHKWRTASQYTSTRLPLFVSFSLGADAHFEPTDGKPGPRRRAFPDLQAASDSYSLTLKSNGLINSLCLHHLSTMLHFLLVSQSSISGSKGQFKHDSTGNETPLAKRRPALVANWPPATANPS